MVGALLSGCAPAEEGSEAGTPTPGSDQTSRAVPRPVRAAGARVVWVADGDTVDVRLRSGQRRRVRLLGVDAPESRPDRVDCGGPAAAAALRRRLPGGTRVRLVVDAGQDRHDRYGRLLRYVVDRRGDVDRWLVARGHARVYVFGRRPFARYDGYRTAERRAQRLRRGLWGRC